MNDWWKAPVLQGDDNDYGQYDYMIEEIPQDYARWEFDKYRWKCDDCGKESHLRFCSEHFFHTLDGWDSMAYAECWRCRLKGNIKSFKWKIKRWFKNRTETIKTAIELYKGTTGWSLKHCYEMAKLIVR